MASIFCPRLGMTGDIAAINKVIGQLYKSDSRRILATLIRLLGDIDTAEDALHDAFAAAAKQWPEQGVPTNPASWLISTGRFKGIDAIRRHSRFDSSLAHLADELPDTNDRSDKLLEAVPDDQLRLIFTCCHPSLSPEARLALTLREVCGLTTEEIARAFLTAVPTIAQRIVRAKAKIRDARIPYVVPSAKELPERVGGVLRAIYLVFNEGYSATSGASITRADLSGEAIRLGRLLVELLPDPEAVGLLGLMLLQESRRGARSNETGDLVLLEDQDRSLWDRAMIDEGVRLVRRSLVTRSVGAYTVQAAIAAVHAEAPSSERTDWPQIVNLYDLLLRAHPSPVIELNRAVAVAMRDGPDRGIELIDEILGRGDLVEYHLAHSARGELCRRVGRSREAREAFMRALELARLEPERRFIEGRLATIPAK